MGEQRVLLEGFERALAAKVAAEFRFKAEDLKHLKLELGRHIFVQDMDESEDLARTSEDYEEGREPTISIYTSGGASVTTGSKHEWVLRVVLRFGVVPDRTKALLEELFTFLQRACGPIGKHHIFRIDPLSRPSVFERAGDEHAYAECDIRARGVPRP